MLFMGPHLTASDAGTVNVTDWLALNNARCHRGFASFLSCMIPRAGSYHVLYFADSSGTTERVCLRSRILASTDMPSPAEYKVVSMHRFYRSA